MVSAEGEEREGHHDPDRGDDLEDGKPHGLVGLGELQLALVHGDHTGHAHDATGGLVALPKSATHGFPPGKLPRTTCRGLK